MPGSASFSIFICRFLYSFRSLAVKDAISASSLAITSSMSSNISESISCSIASSSAFFMIFPSSFFATISSMDKTCVFSCSDIFVFFGRTTVSKAKGFGVERASYRFTGLNGSRLLNLAVRVSPF